LSGNDIIHIEAHYVVSNVKFFEKCWSVYKYQPPLPFVTHTTML